MNRRILVASAAAALALFCAKHESSAPAAPPPQAVQQTESAAPQPAVAKSDDGSLATDAQRVKKMLDEWHGDTKQLDEGRDVVMTMLARDRDYAPAYILLSRIERKGGYVNYSNYDSDALTRSRKFAEHGLKLDPKSADAYFTLGYVQMAQHDYDSARASFDSAEQLGLSPVNLREGRAEIAYAEHDSKTVLRLMNETVQAPDVTATQRANAYRLIALVYRAADDIEDAGRAYREQLKLVPDDAWTYGNYADFLLQHGKVDEAIQNAERAVHLMSYPMGYHILTQAYIAKADELWDAKQFARAADYMDKAAAISGDNPELYYYLGFAYERASKRVNDAALATRAVAAYRKALALKPDLRAAADGLKRLEH